MNISKIIKITTIGMIGTILLTIAGAFLFTFYVNNMSQASLISYAQNYIENHTSQKTNIEKIDVHLSNRLSIKINNIVIDHASWAKSDHFLTASSLELDLNPFALLLGKYDISELKLKNANFAFERHNEFGWGVRKKEFGIDYEGEIDDDLEQNFERDAYEAEMEEDSTDIRLNLDVLIGKLDVSNVKITSYDHHFQSGHEYIIDNISLREDNSNINLSRLDANVVANDLPIKINGTILNINADMLSSDIDFPIDLNINAGNTNITLNGVITDVIGKAEKNIKFTLNSPNISQIGNAIGRKISDIGALDLSVNIMGDINNIILNDISILLEKPQAHSIKLNGSSHIAEGIADTSLQTSIDIKNSLALTNSLQQLTHAPIFANLPLLTNIKMQSDAKAIIDPRGLLLDIINLKLDINDPNLELSINGNIEHILEGKNINLNIEKFSTPSLTNLSSFMAGVTFEDKPLSFKGRVVGQASKALLVDAIDFNIGDDKFNGTIAGKISQGNFVLDTDPNDTTINVIELLAAMTK